MLSFFVRHGINSKEEQCSFSQTTRHKNHLLPTRSLCIWRSSVNVYDEHKMQYPSLPSPPPKKGVVHSIYPWVLDSRSSYNWKIYPFSWNTQQLYGL